MYSTTLSRALVTLLSASLVSAQTFSECNPVEGDECDPNPALADEIVIDWTKKSDFFELAAGTKLTYESEKGAVFTCAKETDAPTVSAPEYIFFGELEVEMMAAPGAGIVTSIVLQSDCLDEIDWEWVGGSPDQVQTNYFSKGSTETYDRGGYHDAPGSMTEFHTYKIVWTEEALHWMIDGKTIRTLTYEDAKGGKEYPQTLMQVKLGTWVAGKKDAPEGTREWAGGLANFDDGPTHAYYKRVVITDYAGGVEGAKSYIYSDDSGTWESIFIDTDGGVISEKETDNDEEDQDNEDSKDEGEDEEESEDDSSSSDDSTATESSSSSSSTSTAEESDKPTDVPDSGAAANTFAMAGLALSGLALFANAL